MRIKERTKALVLSPVNGGQGASKPHVVGQLAQLVNVENEEWLVDFLGMVAENNAGFHLKLRPHAAVLLLLSSQIEPTGHRFIMGCLNVAVPQAFTFTWLSTAVTVLPGTPVGIDEDVATQIHSLIL